MYATIIAATLAAILLLAAAIGVTNDFHLLRFWITVMFVVIAVYFFILNYRFLSLAAFIAALLFNPYYYPSLPRQIWVMLDLVGACGVIYAAYWATNPYKKGTRFEQYVTTLFPEPDFVIVDRTRDVSKFLNRRVESDLHPDFVFRNTKTGKMFAIECKWRAQWSYNKHGEPGIWWKQWQSERYAAYGKEAGMPVFVALGIGGLPQKPKEVYFLEADRLHYVFLLQSLIQSGRTAGQISDRPN